MNRVYDTERKLELTLREQIGLFAGEPLREHPDDRFAHLAQALGTHPGKVYASGDDALLYEGDCVELLASMPPGSAELVVTSPPYNIGKRYEKKRIPLDDYLEGQRTVIAECVRVLRPGGSICWEVGNHVRDGEVYPLDALLYPIFKQFDLRLRNRIVWHYEHGLHSSRRLSGRHESILWFTKGDEYVFNLDAVRVPQKYPGKKYYKGPKTGEFSSNPLGKNPGDVWAIPNVKHNHPEKTVHPCQFPVELIERLVLALTNSGDLVVDPYLGVGTTAIAAIRHGRRAVGADTSHEFLSIARDRLALAATGQLRTRPMDRPIYVPPNTSSLARTPLTFRDKHT